MGKWLNGCARLLVVSLVVSLLLVAAPADAAKRKQSKQLEEMQTAYAAAVRWGDFELAWELVDPAYREANPMTELMFNRYKQIEISGYSDRTTAVTPEGDVIRNIELRVINRHNMSERTLRYREQWHWDPVSKRWWLAVGLPDLWNGE